MGKFEIKKRINGDFMFNLKANNGQIILTSQGYASKSGCENGIDSVKNMLRMTHTTKRKFQQIQSIILT